nr:Probable ATP-dependent RNA helicase DDX46 [Euglena gracilis]
MRPGHSSAMRRAPTRGAASRSRSPPRDKGDRKRKKEKEDRGREKKRLKLGRGSDSEEDEAASERRRQWRAKQEERQKREEEELDAELEAEARAYHNDDLKGWTLSDEEDEDEPLPLDLLDPDQAKKEADEDVDPLDAFMVGVCDELKSLAPVRGQKSNVISASEIMALTTQRKLTLVKAKAAAPGPKREPKPAPAPPPVVKSEPPPPSLPASAGPAVAHPGPAENGTAAVKLEVATEVKVKVEPTGPQPPQPSASNGLPATPAPAAVPTPASEATAAVAADPEEEEEERFRKELLEKVRQLEPAPVDLHAAPAQAEDAGQASSSRQRGELYFEGDDWEWGPEDEDLSYTVPREIKPVDHAKLFADGSYQDFRKRLFIVPKELQALTPDEVKALRKELDGTKVTDRRNECPPPVRRWEHCGLPDPVLEALRRLEYAAPFAVQAQAIPAIMSGRDVMASASTGSGKTLSYVLPALRHILDQDDIKVPLGPIALVLVPTRELATQVAAECRKFAKVVDLRVCCCYGGAPIADQIAELKRFPHIIAATPGRMLDMLLANKGRVTCLTRVTFLVFDEADRMFDMGFGPQVAKICDNTRPDRQTIMISATFPKAVEAAAKQWLKEPVEITVGGRSSACRDVAQFVELFDGEEGKFLRLLQVLGEWVTKGLILVFVDTQAECDDLYQDLHSAGYGPQLCMLHGGMDQYDREYTMYDFKNRAKTVMVATSIVARGLDIRALELVINYKCPNHYEDYVHRVGRTGRAGKKGTAYTFVVRETDDHMAGDLVRALKSADCAVPEELEAKAAAYWNKAKLGLVVFKKRSGYGGKGFKFSSAEGRKKREEVRKQMKAMGLMDELSDSSDDGVEDERDIGGKAATRAAKERAAAPVETETVLKLMHNPKTMKAAMAIQQAQAFAVQLAVHDAMVKEQQSEGHFTADVEINDYHELARREVTIRSTVDALCEQFNVTISPKGVYAKTGRPPPGERLLYLFIEGSTAQEVAECKKEIQRRLDDKVKDLLMRGGERSAFANKRVMGPPPGRAK